MTKELPFDEDVMTLIMGLGGPEKPGQHGRVNVPEPDGDVVKLVTDIRDMCEEFLRKCGKSDSDASDKEDSGSGDEKMDKEGMPDEEDQDEKKPDKE